MRGVWAWALGVGLVLGGVAQRPLIVVLQSGEGGFYDDALQQFQKALAQQGIDAQLERFVCKGDPSDAALPAQLVARKPALMVALGTDAATMLRTHYATLPDASRAPPVVFALVVDPLAQGLVQSEERSGTRFAGVALTIRPQRQFQALQDVAPKALRIGVVYNPNDAASKRMIEQGREDAQRLGLTLVEALASSPAEVPRALTQLQDTVDALWLIPDPVCASAEPLKAILEWTQKRKIPMVAFAESFVRRGALMAIGVDLAEQGALAAELAARILNGEPPETLPLLTPRRLLTYYNLKTAQSLNLTIAPMLLNLATRVHQ